MADTVDISEEDELYEHYAFNHSMGNVLLISAGSFPGAKPGRGSYHSPLACQKQMDILITPAGAFLFLYLSVARRVKQRC